MSTIYGMTVTFGGSSGSSGGTVPQVIVNAPTGSTVTATKGDVTLTAAEKSGVWVFDLPEFGSWAITATNGVQTATQSVVFEGEKMLTFSYFSATIAVTYPAGSTCTCSNGVTTLTAPDTSGSCTFVVTGVGTWTVYCTDGTNEAATDVEIENDGQASTAKLGYYEANFADNDWATIIEMCQSGSVPNTWVVGDSKPMTINGTTYNIDIVDKNHDTYTEGGTAPLTFGLNEIYSTLYAIHSSATNVNGYDSMTMHTTTLPSIKSTMPLEVQAAIKAVNKLASAGNKSSTIETISCELFLYSEIEVLGTVKRSVSGEGSQYAYFQNGGSAKKTTVAGSSGTYLLRSPVATSNTSFCAITFDGADYSVRASDKMYITFAFCF